MSLWYIKLNVAKKRNLKLKLNKCTGCDSAFESGKTKILEPWSKSISKVDMYIQSIYRQS